MYLMEIIFVWRYELIVEPDIQDTYFDIMLFNICCCLMCFTYMGGPGKK